MPPDWTLGRSESGWMKDEVFFEYVVNDFNAWVEKNNIQKPIPLLVDGHKSHMSLVLSSMCEELKIILYALPPNTTHMLQPADVSDFAPLKADWRKVVRVFLSKLENVNFCVTKTNVCQLFKEIIENPHMKTYIINGFRSFPLIRTRLTTQNVFKTPLNDSTNLKIMTKIWYGYGMGKLNQRH